MDFRFVAQQKTLGMSECEQLCARPSREIEDLAFRGGWRGTPGEPLRVFVGTALNMLVLSVAKSHGVEMQSMAAWLPGLREEALLRLGAETSNWSFEGAHEAEQQFWPVLYGSRDAVRPRIASFLGCHSNSPTAQLRFFSLNDVECLSIAQTAQGASSRTPRFIINAHTLAEQVQITLRPPLFTAKAVDLR